MDGKTALAQLGNAKNTGAKKGKKGRCAGRNFRWDGVSHSLTKYVGSGGPARAERRKAARLAKRRSRFARLAAKRLGGQAA